MKLWIILIHIILALLLLAAVVLYQHCCNVKDKISKFVKNYIVQLIIGILLFSLISPIILYLFGVFKEGRALYNSDVLGYYGAIIGGGITVLGIYWTFNYERLISAEEQKEASLPILKFSLRTLTESEASDSTEPYDLHIVRGLEINVKRDDLKEEEEKLHSKLKRLDNQDQLLQNHFARIRLRERIACPSNSTESLSSRAQKNSIKYIKIVKNSNIELKKLTGRTMKFQVSYQRFYLCKFLFF